MPPGKFAAYRTLRVKLLAAFLAIAAFVAASVGMAVVMHYDTVERAAQLEAAHLAEMIADAAIERDRFRPDLQAYVTGLHVLHKRDIVVVDASRKGIADADAAEVGLVYNHDPGDQVGRTIADGRVRWFIERNALHPEGAWQIVVPLRKHSSDARVAGIGAVILEYTTIREELLAAEREDLHTTVAVGAAMALLVAFFGLTLSRRISGPLAELRAGADRIAAGDYGARVTVRSGDETGLLGEAFNRMAGDLSVSHSELVESRRELENRVAQRTRDLTHSLAEQKRAEAGVKQLNRVYAVLSGINSLIVRVGDREELFRQACRIAVEEGRFAKAWIGLVEEGPKGFRIAASRGGDPRFFPRLETLVREKFVAGQGHVARAVTTLRPAISNEIATDPEVAMKDDAVQGGVQSLAVLPLVIADKAIGVLTLNADAAGFFDAEEMKLLTELAGNIAFAIDHIEKRERIEYLAYYDGLTGLANRDLYLQRLARYLGAAGHEDCRLAVVVIDIERFRAINESAGRAAGDDLLRQFTARVQSHMIDPKWLARIGPDQFASIVPDAASEEAVARIEQRMGQVLDRPFMLGELEVRISAKIGIALHPVDGPGADTLLRNAEAALKKAKSAGERYLFYTPDMNARVAANLTLENRLRRALEREEFVLHYQPKIALQSGKLTGAEALIRWNDPQSGLVPPGHFIPILEDTGLILEAGRWALRKALEDYLRWRAAGLPAVRIAVNVSPLQLRNRDFVAGIAEAIGVHADAPGGLELEITESVIMHDTSQNIATLQSVRDLGVTVAIDDFGTGFSSLSYLAKLPVDTLKIDRSFIIDMTEGPQGLALVSTIIHLAHSLDLKVVAEGVETAEQSNLLRLLSCDEMQGFLFSKAVPAAEFEAKFLAVPVPGGLVPA